MRLCAFYTRFSANSKLFLKPAMLLVYSCIFALLLPVSASATDDQEDFNVNSTIRKLRPCAFFAPELFPAPGADLSDADYYSLLAQHLISVQTAFPADSDLVKGQMLQDTNGNLEVVTSAGHSSAAAPNWNAAVNGNTADNSAIWTNYGPPNLPAQLAGGEPFLRKLASEGKLSVEDAPRLIRRVSGWKDRCNSPLAASDTDRVSIIHIVRWADSGHTTVKFQKWYVYDPNGAGARRFTLTSAQTQFEGAAIAGRTHYRLIYIYFNYDLAAREEDNTHAPRYKITVTKQQRQVVKDLQTVLKLTGLAAAAAQQTMGFFSSYDFDSAFKTSLVSVNASLQDAASQASPPKTTDTKANGGYSRAYTNESPFWLGLSFTVPLTSYKDLTLDNTANILTPKTVNRQNIYLAADFYLPSALPSYTQFRYLPHPFFGIPIKGQPLRNTMAGLALGFRWLEPFAGVVFNDQRIKGANGQPTDHWVRKGAYGLKISVDAAAKALSASAKTTK